MMLLSLVQFANSICVLGDIAVQVSSYSDLFVSCLRNQIHIEQINATTQKCNNFISESLQGIHAILVWPRDLEVKTKLHVILDAFVLVSPF